MGTPSVTDVRPFSRRLRSNQAASTSPAVCAVSSPNTWGGAPQVCPRCQRPRRRCRTAHPTPGRYARGRPPAEADRPVPRSARPGRRRRWPRSSRRSPRPGTGPGSRGSARHPTGIPRERSRSITATSSSSREPRVTVVAAATGSKDRRHRRPAWKGRRAAIRRTTAGRPTCRIWDSPAAAPRR